MTSDALLAAIVRSSEDAINSVDFEGRITSWNAGAERLYGHSASEAVGSLLSLHVPAECARETAEGLERIRRGETLRHFETVRMRKDGRAVDVSLTISPIRDETGDIIGASAIARDITAEKHAGEFATKLLRAVEQAENVVLITDAGGRMIFVNPAFERVYGLSASAALGQTPRILKSGKHDRAFYEQFWKAMISGSGYHGEMVNRAGDGRLVTIEVSSNAIFDEKGTILGFIAVQHDVTEKKLLQTQFIQAQKIEAVGRLAGGIAHDFNNLLTAILGYSEMLECALPAGSAPREHAGEIRLAAERAASLTHQLLAFSRHQVLAVEPVDLNDLVRESHGILGRVLGEDVEIRLDLDPAIGTVKADRGQIAQVFMNLAINARDAMPTGGTLSIGTRNVEIDDSYVPATALQAVSGPYVLVTFSDTGIGMDEETRARMFEPFFTTKDPGKGTGLGLSTVYGIVKQVGGFLWVYSEPGRGAVFKVYLPRTDEGPRAAAAARRSDPPVQGTGTILVVEDDGAVRSFIRLTLADAGYVVLEAARGEDALELARLRREPIDLFITDSVLPGIGGPELAGRLAALHPEARMLFISGYAANDAYGTYGPGGPGAELAFLQKPFSAGALTRRIAEILRPKPPD